MSARMDEEWKPAEEPSPAEGGEEGEEDRPQEGDFDVRPWQTEEVIDMVRVPPVMIHLALVLLLGWIASFYNLDLRFVFALGFAHICYIESRQRRKIETRIRNDERKVFDRKRLMSGAETVRWLNSVVKSTWPIFLQQFASEHFLMTIAPWFLERYKPWTAKKVVIQKLYLGKNPPKFTFVRAGRQDPPKGYHMVLEMTINIEASKDMHGVMAVQVRKRLGLGLWTSVHISDLQMEGNVKLALKFVNGWPAIKRVRLCFTEAPTIRMVAKPVFSSGVDVADLPVIESWLHKMINDALQQSLVQPNQLTLDVEKLVGDLIATHAEIAQSGTNQTPGSVLRPDSRHAKMFKGSIATLLVEVLEAEKLKPADSNGKSDPYVKITSGKTAFTTTIKERTLNPQWYEQFNLPIMDWGMPLKLRVRDKDMFFRDDELGFKEISLSDEIRDGQRHQMWVQLDGVKTGRLQVALTVKETPIVDTAEGSLDEGLDRVDNVHGQDSASSQIEDIEAVAFHGIHVDGSSSASHSGELKGGNAHETGDGNGNGDHSVIKASIATLLVEILKAENLTPADSNGKSDPYVKINSGTVVFTTSIKKKTLHPEWYERFHVPVINWNSRLKLRVRDKDMFSRDDEIGFKEIDLSEEIRDGQRHEMWVQLDGVKTGRLLIALTVQDLPIVDTSAGIRDKVDNLKGEESGLGPDSSAPSPVLTFQETPTVDTSERTLDRDDNLKGEDAGLGPGRSTSSPADGSQKGDIEPVEVAGSSGMQVDESSRVPNSQTEIQVDESASVNASQAGMRVDRSSSVAKLQPGMQEVAGSSRVPNSQARMQVDGSSDVQTSQSGLQVDGPSSMAKSQVGMQIDESSSMANSQVGMQGDGSSSVPDSPNSSESQRENESGNNGAEELRSPKERSRMRRMGRGVRKRMEKTAHNINQVFHR